MKTLNYSNWDLIKDLGKFIKPHKWKFFWGTFFRVTSDLTWLFPAIAVGEIINTLSVPSGVIDTNYIMLLLGIWLAAIIYHNIFHDIAKYMIYNIAERASYTAVYKAIQHLISLDVAWHEKESSGNKLKRIVKGEEGINRIIRLYVDLFIESTINVIGIIIILSTFNKLIGMLMLLFLGSYYILSLLLLKKAKHYSHLFNLSEEEMYGSSFEMINNIATVKWLGLYSILKNFNKVLQKVVDTVRLRIFHYRLRAGVLGIYKNLFLVGILAFIVYGVVQGQYEVGLLALFTIYFWKLSAAADEFAHITAEFIILKLGVNRMMGIFQAKPIVENTGKKKFSDRWKKIKIRNLSFAYKKRKYLSNLDLTINRGEKIGIVGLSGAGKTTLFKLLLKLYVDYEGCIRFDKTPLSVIKRNSYLNHTAVVLQETELFNLSLEDNIMMADKKKDRKRLAQAMKIAHVTDFLNKMPQREKTVIGEKGVKLSGGEKQRVGIARAIYKQPQILFMDEATSHLDLDSEELIQDSLKKFFKNVTAIVIAHRLSTIKEMDSIIVMKDGAIIEQGSFNYLMKKKGEFHRLWKKQLKKK